MIFIMEKLEPKIQKEKTEEEKKKEKEENYGKMEKILEMFGTGKAKERFENLIDEYRQILQKVKLKSETEAQTYEKGRAETHKKIMDTLTALSLHQKSGGEGEKVLRSLADKDAAAQAIDDYYAVKFEKEHPALSEFGKIYHKLNNE